MNEPTTGDEVIQVGSRFYILATSSLADDRSWRLKDGESFGLFDRYGDIQQVGIGEQGLFHEGTRFLSRCELRLGTIRAMLLSSTPRDDNQLLAVDLTNPDLYSDGRLDLPRQSYHLFRSKFIWRGVCYERFRVKNFSDRPVSFSLTFRFEADFADLFEIRGSQRKQKGRMLEPQVAPDRVALGYQGLDEVVRTSVLHFEPAPASLSSSQAAWSVELEPGAERLYSIRVQCQCDEDAPPLLPYDEAFLEALESSKRVRNQFCSIHTGNEQFNDWINRSLTDVQMLLTHRDAGLYPYAGIPWFCTPFGRDGIITAMECLWMNPDIAKGVLSYLAMSQAKTVDSRQDAEPGKILHEAREGEMAKLGEVPFGLYYGSVDSTPLFVMLAGAYYERTGDLAGIQAIWSSIERAMHWIENYGDKDGDGFIEYARGSDTGLINQGWKDSWDSVFHADGTLAEGPIALCEVQGYAYAARRAAASLASLIGKLEQSRRWAAQAQDLQARFERDFWCEEIGTYVPALDGRKRPCKVRTSNAGHCLFSGIASREHAERVARQLTEPGFFSGWGIRTLAAGEPRYNPMSYHNGSIWPHDSALISLGMRRYGLKKEILKTFSGLFDASIFMNLHRLPELFCGFDRRAHEGATLYPVACSPQAWSAASVFMMIQACLGISFNGPNAQLRFTHPVLPESVQSLWIKDLRLGDGRIDLVAHRHDDDVSIDVTRRQGSIDVSIVK